VKIQIQEEFLMSKWMKKEEKMGHIGGKVCIFGEQGTGKSTILGTFPRINLVEAEEGNAFYLEGNDNILNILPTTSAAEVQEAMDELENDEFLEQFDTLGIDSGTKLKENMESAAYEIVEKRARKQRAKGQDVDVEDLNLSVRDWGHIRRWNQQLATSYIKMSSRGKWVVVIAHNKELTEEVGTGNNKKTIKIGDRPDLAKKAEHDFDIILRTFTRKNPATQEITFHAEVFKDRTLVTKVGDILDNPTFEIWREKWESTRKYGIKAVDMSKDVEKSVKKMEDEEEQIEELIADFKVKMKKLDAQNQVKVQKKLQDLGIANPLKTTDLDGMKSLIEFIDLLQ
jgi:hypothetical protein